MSAFGGRALQVPNCHFAQEDRDDTCPWKRAKHRSPISVAAEIAAQIITVARLRRWRAVGRRDDDLGAQARSTSLYGGGRNRSVAKCRSGDGSKTRYR